MTKAKILLILLCNIMLSFGLARAQHFSSINQQISPCTTNCLTLEIPSPIIVNNPIYINNQDTTLYHAFNPNLNQKITVTDLRNSNQNWNVTAQSTPLQKITNIQKQLNYNYIGINTFSNSPQGYQTLVEESAPSVIAPLNQNIGFNNFQNNTLNQGNFNFFSGNNQIISDPLVVLNSTNPKPNQFFVFLGTAINIPSTEVANLDNGQYIYYLTFTLS